MRVKLVYQGRYRNPSTGLYEQPMWAPPTDDLRTCPHPRQALRFDPRYSVPVACYCRACGMPRIHPFHGLSPEQVEERKQAAAALLADLS